MKDNFENCLKETLKWEGYISDHPSDPGGLTNQGITHGRYDEWRQKKGLPKRSVKLLTVQERDAIYREDYWDAVNGDNRPLGVDLVIFDFGVNSGPSRARKYASTVAKPGLSEIEFIEAYCAARLKFLKRLGTWPVFGKGWERRVNGIEAVAKVMATHKDNPSESLVADTNSWWKVF